MEPSPPLELAAESYRHLAGLLAARTIRQYRYTTAIADHPKKGSDAKRGSVKSAGRFSDADFLLVPLEVARHLLHGRPPFVPASILLQASTPWGISTRPPATTATDIKESHTAIDRETYIPICQQCGAAMQPADWSGTIVRLKSCSSITPLSRSARRRASRRKATSMKKHNEKYPHTILQTSYSNLSHYVQDHQRRIFACCANYSQITCGSCGEVSRLAGQPNRKPHGGSRKNHNIFKDTISMRDHTSDGSSRQGSKACVKKAEANGEEDFLSLGPKEVKPKRMKELPKLGQPKRKKTKPGNLLNFLSSLND